jgi:hypothetical protein
MKKRSRATGNPNQRAKKRANKKNGSSSEKVFNCQKRALSFLIEFSSLDSPVVEVHTSAILKSVDRRLPGKADIR